LLTQPPVINAIADAFPSFQFRWLATEIAPHLPLELDFVHEADNAEKCAVLVQEEQAHPHAHCRAGDMVVPEVLREFTT
jgi:aarF domain-containing kinase